MLNSLVPETLGLSVDGVLSKQEVSRLKGEIQRKKKNLSKGIDPSKLNEFGIQEISIPINGRIKRLPQNKMFKLIESEYATIYLERIGVDPNRENIRRILDSVPLRKCKIRYRKGLSETMYVVVRPKVKRQFRPKDDLSVLLDPLHNFNEKKALLEVVEDKRTKKREFSLDSDLQSFTEQFTKLQAMFRKSHRMKKQNSFTKKMEEVGLLGDEEDLNNHEKIQKESAEKKRRNGIKYYNLRKFDDYKLDYIYPWNLANKIDRPVNYDTTLFKIVHGRRENELFSIENEKGDTSIDLSKSELIELFQKELGHFPEIKISLIHRYQVEFIEEFPVREFVRMSESVVDEVKHRLKDKKIGFFVSKISKLCYWLFLREFFNDGEKNDNSTTSTINDYYSAKRELIVIFEMVLTMFRSRKKESHLEKVIINPLVLLCIRVVNEAVFRSCYPSLFQTPNFVEELKQRMDTLITFMIDPQYYSSHFASITQNIKSRKMEKRILKTMKQSYGNDKMMVSRRNSHLSVSPMIRMLLRNPQSTGARGLMMNEDNNRRKRMKNKKKKKNYKNNENINNDGDDFPTDSYGIIMKDLLEDDARLRAKLVAIFIRRSGLKKKMRMRGVSTNRNKKVINRRKKRVIRKKKNNFDTFGMIRKVKLKQ